MPNGRSGIPPGGGDQPGELVEPAAVPRAGVVFLHQGNEPSLDGTASVIERGDPGRRLAQPGDREERARNILGEARHSAELAYRASGRRLMTSKTGSKPAVIVLLGDRAPRFEFCEFARVGPLRLGAARPPRAILPSPFAVGAAVGWRCPTAYAGAGDWAEREALPWLAPRVGRWIIELPASAKRLVIRTGGAGSSG
jgi:hypothetical protein